MRTQPKRAIRRNALRDTDGGIRYWRTEGLHLDPIDCQPTAFYRTVVPHNQMMSLGSEQSVSRNRLRRWGNEKIARLPMLFDGNSGKPISTYEAASIRRIPPKVLDKLFAGGDGTGNCKAR